MMNLLPDVQTAVRFAVCIALTAALPLTACMADPSASRSGDNLTGYALEDAVYTAEFPVEDSNVSITACCVRSGGITTMQITSPDRIAGLTVTYDETAGSCSVSAGEMSILLSPETASGLTVLFDLLARPAEDGGLPAKSPDGTQTVVSFDTGSVTVSESGLPVEVTMDTRTVRIGGFTIQ